MKRRMLLGSLLGLVGNPLMAQGFLNTENIIDVPKVTGDFQEIRLERPWGQILRTFGNPVLEGHFSMRVSASNGNLDMAMWDRGDRILGMAQYSNKSPRDLWPMIEAIMSRRPDLTIGPGSVSYTHLTLPTKRIV